MITVQNAEDALKNIYLEGVINDINTKTNPFLTMVQKNARKAKGMEARTVIRYGNEASVITGADGGELPTAKGKSAEIVSPLKNIYGTFQISDKAIRAASTDAAAFNSLIIGEMQNLIGVAQNNLNGMLYGNGKKLIGYSEACVPASKEFTLPARFIGNFAVGDAISIYTAGNALVKNVTVATVTPGTRKITVTESIGAEIASAEQDRFYFYGVADAGEELNGIDSIFRQDAIYNLGLSEYGAIAPCKVENTGLQSVKLDEDKIMNFFDKYEEHCQGMPADILLTHPNVRRSMFDSLKQNRANMDMTELAGGFRGFSFNGIPVYSDVKCKAGSLYALNSDSWAMHQLCDWEWLSGDEGGILRQVDGHAGYTATLVKYADLVCDKPFIQGKVAGYSSAV